MAYISVTHTFSNSTTADATQVNTNFTDIINGTSDGTKDFSINALTCAGAATLNGNVTLGNASGDDVTVTGSLASSIPIKTTFSYDVGAATLGLRYIFLGSADSAARSTKIAGATVASSWTLTLPTSGGTSGWLLQTNGSGTTSWTPQYGAYDLINYSIVTSVDSNALTIAIKGADGNDPSATNPVNILFRHATATNGTPVLVSITSALSLVVPSGAKLGHGDGVAGYLYPYFINNAGTAELAVSSVLQDERGVQSTTTIDVNSDTSGFYSTTGRSNVPIRLAGRLTSTQTTAGTWATNMSEVSLASLNGYGVNDYREAKADVAAYGITAGQYGDEASLVLPAGEWDMSAIGVWYSNGATTTTLIAIGISTTSGNSTSGMTIGENLLVDNKTTTSGTYTTMTLPSYRVVVTTSTTYYLKTRADTSITNLSLGYRISARRIG